MSFSSIITLFTDGLISLTLLYCIVLERRIRAFRKQEQAFRALIDDVSESTRLAQGAASSLRQLMGELGKNGTVASHGTQGPAFGREPMMQGGSPQMRRPADQGSVSALAARVAALRGR
jgi:hypothetical protein